MHALKIVSYLVAGFAVRTACQQAPLQDSLSVICEGGIPIGFNFPMTTLDETFTLQAISTNLTGDSLPLVEENSSLRYIRTKLGQADADGVPLTLKDGFVAREDGRDLQSRGGYGILLALAPHSKGSLTWQAEYKCKPGDTPALILSLTGKSAEQFPNIIPTHGKIAPGDTISLPVTAKAPKGTLPISFEVIGEFL